MPHTRGGHRSWISAGALSRIFTSHAAPCGFLVEFLGNVGQQFVDFLTSPLSGA